MLYSPQDERKLVMLENSLNFRFKKIGTPGAKEIAEASAEIATKKYVKMVSFLAYIFDCHFLTCFHSINFIYELNDYQVGRFRRSFFPFR